MPPPFTFLHAGFAKHPGPSPEARLLLQSTAGLLANCERAGSGGRSHYDARQREYLFLRTLPDFGHCHRSSNLRTISSCFHKIHNSGHSEKETAPATTNNDRTESSDDPWPS